MADTCFLCAVGSKNATTSPMATSTEGFGTCENCSVHACPKHGERQAQYFRCADCITGNALQGALGPGGGQTDLDRGDADPVDQYGRLALVAESPGVALAGLDLFEYDLVEPMRAGLARLGGTPSGAIDGVRVRLTGGLADAEFGAVEAALSLPAELVGRLRDGLRGSGADGDPVVKVALVKLHLIFQALDEQSGTIQPTSEPSVNRAEYSLAVLAGAFAAREASTLRAGVLTVAGGLQMPPLVILLSTLLVTELERGPENLPELRYS